MKRGQTQSSTGISHLRFERDGHVVMRHDYWDSADGLYEKVPLLGWAIKTIKARL